VTLDSFSDGPGITECNRQGQPIAGDVMVEARQSDKRRTLRSGCVSARGGGYCKNLCYCI
jgi:hypothetical protein